MADRWAIASGNWSDTATWNGGTLPQAGDDVYADGRTVAIDQNVTVASIRTTQRSGGTANGAFTISGSAALTITANLYGHGSTCITYTSSGTSTFIGSVRAGASGHGIYVSAGNGTVNVVGDVYGSTSGTVAGVHCLSSAATTNITGDVTPEIGVEVWHAVQITGGTVNIYPTGGTAGGLIIGDCVAVTIHGGITAPASTFHGLYWTGTGNVTVLGNVTAAFYTGVTMGIGNLVVEGSVTAAANIGISIGGAGTCEVTGNVTGSNSANNVSGITFAIGSTVTIVGNVLAGSGSISHGVSGSGTLNLTGNATGNGPSACGVYMPTAGSLTIVGNVVSGPFSASPGVDAHGTTAVSITGNIYGGTTPAQLYGIGAYLYSSNAMSVVGNVVGGSSSGSPGIFFGNGTLTITGNVTGGTGASYSGYVSTGVMCQYSGPTQRLTVTGTATATNENHGIYCDTSFDGLVTVGSLVAAANGRVAVRATYVLIDDDAVLTHTYRVNTGGSAGVTRSLYTANAVSFDQPAEADVREGTSYAGGTGTGTLAVPDPAYVALGVPTDDTVGTLVPSLSAADIRAAVGLAAANLDTQLAAISDDIDASVLGTGARLVTITVVDLDTGDPIQDARVRLSAAGIGTRVKRTNASGVVSFSADDADYDVTITAADHDFTPTTLTVDGNETVTYEMSGQDWPDSTEPDTVTVRWRVMSYTTRQPVGAAEATVYMRIRNGPYQDGFAWNRTADSDTTDASGYVSFANVPVHCTVEARLGTTGDWIPVEIPSDATSPYDAAPLWGALPDA